MLLFALRSQHRPDFVTLAVVSVKHHIGAILLRAEVGGIDDQALMAALHLHDSFADGGVGDTAQGGADTALLGVDPGDDFDVDLPMQGKDQVGQLVIGGPQETGPSKDSSSKEVKTRT